MYVLNNPNHRIRSLPAYGSADISPSQFNTEQNPLYAAPADLDYSRADEADEQGYIAERLIGGVVIDISDFSGTSLHPMLLDRLREPIITRRPVVEVHDNDLETTFHIEDRSHQTRRMIADYALYSARLLGGGFTSIEKQYIARIPPKRFDGTSFDVVQKPDDTPGLRIVR